MRACVHSGARGVVQGDAPTLAADLDGQMMVTYVHAEASARLVAGHDFGGPVALLLARSRPDLVTHLALFSTNAFTDTPVPFPLSTINTPLVGRLAASVLFSTPSLWLMLRSGTGRPRTHLNVAAHLGDWRQQSAIRTIFEGSLRHLAELYAPVEDALETVRVPAHVGWGARDPFFTVEQGRRTATALRAAFELLPEAGHFLPEERPVEVAAAIRSLALAPADRPEPTRETFRR